MYKIGKTFSRIMRSVQRTGGVPGRVLNQGYPVDQVCNSHLTNPSGFIKTTTSGGGVEDGEFATREFLELGMWKFTIANDATNGSDVVTLFNANMPYKVQILDAWAIAQEAESSSTVQLTNGTTAITSTMATATNHAIARATTIDDATAVIAAGGTLAAVFAGGTDRPASQIYILFARIQ